MKIVYFYSHHDALCLLQDEYKEPFEQIRQVINCIDAEECRTKVSREKTMPGQQLYNPKALNKRFKQEFASLGWGPKRIQLVTPDLGYGLKHTGFREVDFVKSDLGLEVQFGKYAFLVYDIISKMVIFRQRGLLRVGVEILPTKAMVAQMSSGVGHFEQVVADLYHRGSDPYDLPVLILGIAASCEPLDMGLQARMF